MDYNYEEAVKEDVEQYISDNYDEEELIEKLADRDSFVEELDDILWAEDSVTGNGSGSYTFSTYKAEEYLCHNLDLLVEAVENFGGDMMETIKRGAENCDVTIRCNLLAQAISDVVDNLCDQYADEIAELNNNEEE